MPIEKNTPYNTDEVGILEFATKGDAQFFMRNLPKFLGDYEVDSDVYLIGEVIDEATCERFWGVYLAVTRLYPDEVLDQFPPV